MAETMTTPDEKPTGEYGPIRARRICREWKERTGWKEEPAADAPEVVETLLDPRRTV